MDAYSLISAGSATGEIKELLDQALATSRPRLARPVAFIEQKSPDFAKLAEILRLSAEQRILDKFRSGFSLYSNRRWNTI